MRIAIVTLGLVLCAGGASAQNPPSTPSAPASTHSDGRTVLPPDMADKKTPPKGAAGPMETESGGAPAESPQGQSPPGMIAAPEGSSKTIVDPKK